MKSLRNEEGVALVTAMMLTMITLVITLGLLYMVLSSTKMSGAHKRYATVYEATYDSAAELYPKDIMPYVFNAFNDYTSANRAAGLAATEFGAINLTFAEETNACLEEKLKEDRNSWSSGCLAASNTATSEDPDMTFTLRGPDSGPGYKIYSKIVDATQGMSDLSGMSDVLEATGGVASNSSNPAVFHQPTLLTYNIQGEKENNPKEKSIMEVYYAY